jgi:isopenicillin N synthase-like dioxygenase
MGEAQAMPDSIPVIDIGALYAQDPEAKQQVAAKIGAACDDIGFFYVTNHNVSVEISDAAVAMVDKFFALPETERLKVKADKNNRGYRDIWDSVHSNASSTPGTVSISASWSPRTIPRFSPARRFTRPTSTPRSRASARPSRRTTGRPSGSG